MKRQQDIPHETVEQPVADGNERIESDLLVPVDFSASSKAALLWAAEVAERTGQTLEVLHVVHDPGSQPGTYQLGTDVVLRLEEAGQHLLSTFMSEVVAENPDTPVLARARCTLVTGLPVTRILEIAQQHRAQHIVMGSQGRTGLPHLMLGSKAQRIVQLAPVPVTIVKATPDDEGSPP